MIRTVRGFDRQSMEDGFTLVELLVVLALIGLLSLTITQGLRLGVRAWDRSTQTMGVIEDQALGRAYLRRVVAQAEPRLRSDETGAAAVDFSGSETALEFITRAGLSDRYGVARRLKVSVATRDGRAVLVGATAPQLTAPDGTIGWQDFELLSSDQDMSFAFYGRLRGETDEGWHAAWQDQRRLPQLVRLRTITSTSPGGGGEDLVVRLRREASSDCVIDPITHYCRGRVGR